MSELFAYGTLRDPEYQRELFGHELRMRPATLPNWKPVVAEGGYFTIVPVEGDRVVGDLLELDGADLGVADAWEEVPHYTRLTIGVVAADGAPVEAWVYVRPTESREPAPAGMLARHDRDDVLAAIRRFRATLG
jgi:gamma-glutamylcyclotransferase (GGCT)/AIG2-like uncharacterized protein YtfP